MTKTGYQSELRSIEEKALQIKKGQTDPFYASCIQSAIDSVKEERLNSDRAQVIGDIKQDVIWDRCFTA